MSVIRNILAALLLTLVPLGAGALSAAESAAEEAAPAAAETASENGEAAAAGEAEASEGGTEVVKGTPLLAKLKEGGWIVVILLAISVALVSFTFERISNLKRSNIIPPGFIAKVRSAWQAKDYAGIRRICDEHPSTLARVVRTLVMHRKSTPMELSQLSGDIASQDMRGHMQKLIPFALIATISPLLGLLGTVGGMIESFETVSAAKGLGDASILAGGISHALITTAVGLIVAVPAIAVFNWFKLRTTRLALELDGVVNELISEWFIEESDDGGDGAAQPADSDAGEAEKAA